jgi:hypothetical protein
MVRARSLRLLDWLRLSLLIAIIMDLLGSGLMHPVGLAERLAGTEPTDKPAEPGATEREVEVRDHRGMVPTSPATPPPPKAPHPPIVSAPVDVNPCISSVRAAFLQVSTQGEKLGFHHIQTPGAYQQPGSSHYQGIQRLRRGNFLAVSGSTSQAGELMIVHLPSRVGIGRLQSNLLVPNPISLLPNQPPADDQVVRVESLDRTFTHAGGFQIMGDYLAVGVETGSKSKVLFYDLVNPSMPVKLPYKIIRNPQGQLPVDPSPAVLAEYKRTAGAVGMVKRKDGRYLLVVGRTNSNILDFYLSTTFTMQDPRFIPFTTWHERELRAESGMDREFGNYQNLNFVRQCDGQIFLVGLHNNTAGLNIAHIGEDWADLFRVEFAANRQALITKIANRHLYCKDICNLDAGGGLYVDPSDRLLIYGIEHWRHNNIVRFNEF